MQVYRTREYFTLTRQEVEEIKWLLKNTNMNQNEIATEFDTSPYAIYAIMSKKLFADIETPKEERVYFKVHVKPFWRNSEILPTRG